MSTQTVDSRYLGYSRAARYLGVSTSTLRRMVERGEVRVYKVGERLCEFDREELDQLVEYPSGAEPQFFLPPALIW